MLLSMCVPAPGDSDKATDITIDDIFGRDANDSDGTSAAGEVAAAGERWSLLRFSVNLNPALRDQLSAEISALQSDTEMRRIHDDRAACRGS